MLALTTQQSFQSWHGFAVLSTLVPIAAGQLKAGMLHVTRIAWLCSNGFLGQIRLQQQ